MDNLIKAITDVDRKLGKMQLITAKGPAKMAPKDVMKMAQKGNSINRTMAKAVKQYNANPVPPTDAQAAEFLKKWDTLVAKEEFQMGFARENKPHFERLHIAGLIKKNLQRTEGNAVQFSKLMVGATPLSLKEQAIELDLRVTKAFGVTTALYSNATGGEEEMDKIEDDSE